MGSVKKKSVTYRNLCIFIITVFIFYLFPIKPEKRYGSVVAAEKKRLCILENRSTKIRRKT